MFQKLLIIPALFISCLLAAQEVDDYVGYGKEMAEDSARLAYIYGELSSIDTDKDSFNLFLGSTLAEWMGDYFLVTGNYQQAIAYYDSVDIKYKDLSFCGHANNIGLVVRKFKTSYCFFRQGNLQEALNTFTPFVFYYPMSFHCDSAMLTYYMKLLRKLYPDDQIKGELKKSIRQLDYRTTRFREKNAKYKSLHISCRLSVFGTSLELADWNGPITAAKKFPKRSI